MTGTMRVAIETGPKGKRVVALAPDWPGLERGAKTADDAVARMLSYGLRYAVVADRAGMAADFPADAEPEIVLTYTGTGSTDFWGISFGISELDHQPLPVAELDRQLALMRGAWQVFDEARGRVSAELRKGPRGGGRDRDNIVRHTLFTERDWASGLGVESDPDEMLTDEGLAAYRTAYVDAIRVAHAEGRMAKKWPLRYLIRHTAYHTLDHAWEMEDKDLSGDRGA